MTGGRTRAVVIFDLDGTLIDSSRDLADSVNELIAAYGAQPLPEPVVAGMIGDGARALVERAWAAAGLAQRPDALAQFLEIYDRRLLVHTRPYPGVRELVAALSGRTRLAVLTNKPQAPSNRLLDALDLRPHFFAVLGGDGVHPRKPSPEGLRALVAAAGARADESLLVGDSPVDFETARAAGVDIAFAQYGFGAARVEASAAAAATYVLADPLDLLSYVVDSGRRSSGAPGSARRSDPR
jgi:phosphoglycolate phosphatase